MPRLWWALTQDELPNLRWRAPQRYKILYTLFGNVPDLMGMLLITNITITKGMSTWIKT